MELYLLSGLVLLLAVLLAILAIKFVEMVRADRPLLAIGSFEWRLASQDRQSRPTVSSQKSGNRAETASKMGNWLRRSGKSGLDTEPNAMPAPRLRQRRILTISEVAQIEKQIKANQLGLDIYRPAPDFIQLIESRLELVFDRYCVGSAKLEDFQDILDSLEQEFGRARMLGSASASEVAQAEQVIAWCRNWLAEQERFERAGN